MQVPCLSKMEIKIESQLQVSGTVKTKIPRRLRGLGVYSKKATTEGSGPAGLPKPNLYVVRGTMAGYHLDR